jgi:beta-lactamase class A
MSALGKAAALLGISLAALQGTPAPAYAAPRWTAGLQERLLAVQQQSGGRLGVHVLHVGRGEVLSFRGDEVWYLASTIKVPVAIGVLREIEQGRLRLDEPIRLLEEDFVDGAGQTNSYPPGTELRVEFLLEQMITRSDNTAADVLIRTVGLERLNVLAGELLGHPGFRMTSLADVRRLTYGMFDPRAASLTSRELLVLRRTAFGAPRVRQLAQLLGATPAELRLADMEAAFDAYYAVGVNSATLAQYSRLLEQIARGTVLGQESTSYLLGLMTRVSTGARRIRAALPPESRFAHKTGTQHRRSCDMGVITTRVAERDEHVIVSACVRDVASQRDSDRALREVGAALARSGVLGLSSSREDGG